METLWSIVVGVLGFVLGIVWWLIVNLLWLLAWIVLPVAVLAFVAVRGADYVLGKAVVRGWLKQRSLKWGKGTWQRVRPALFALGTLPLRVLLWLVLYTLWHSLVSLVWTPRWKPWQRAWSRRWRQRATGGVR